MEQISFPVLCLSHDNSICTFPTLRELTRCSTVSLLKNRYYDGLLVYDSSGMCFVVSGADPILESSWTHQLLARIFNQRFTVQLRISHSDFTSLAQIKEAVILQLDKAPDFWSASRQLREWRRGISGASSMSELIALFA